MCWTVCPNESGVTCVGLCVPMRMMLHVWTVCSSESDVTCVGLCVPVRMLHVLDCVSQ